MPFRSRAVSTATCLAVLLFACRSGEVDAGRNPDDPPVAEVNGRIITQSELDDWIRNDLFERETRGKNAGKLFELRSRALDRMIDGFVLRSELERRNLSREELIAQELEAMGPVSDGELEAFYQQHEDQLSGTTFEEVAPRIRAHLEGEREKQVLAALRDRAEVAVHLEPPRFEVAPDGPSRGPADARVTIVEFSDFQCPFCKRALSTLQQVMERYPRDVRVVYRHMPLDSIHRRAWPAAEASACAHDQQKFWPYHDLLFENTRALEESDLLRYAGAAGLDTERFQDCVSQRSFQDKVKRDVEAARSVGVTGTPAFFVNGILVSGAKPASVFFDLIAAELERTESS